MPTLNPLPLLSLLLLLLPSTLAWGREGHQIVATIAQIHLQPNALANICKVLPSTASPFGGGCHLADVAAWADGIKGRMPWTGPMHYINPLNDHPGQTCNFGQDGWTNAKVNVITAIHEKVAVLLNGTRDHRDEEALKFLIHFMGDMHQPLHLTGYLRGGNDAWVRWFGRRQKLHSVWDGSILNEKIATLGNYTSRTSSKQLESALTGQRYDPYIRFIVKEGIWGWWNTSSRSWFDCPSDGDHFPLNPSPAAGILSTLKSSADLLVSFLPAVAQTSLFEMGFASPVIPGFEERVNTSAQGWSPACPYTWAKQIHPINCQYAWPKGFVQHGKDVELDDGEYLPRLTRDKIMESMLAKGGIRLAAILNAIYAHDEVDVDVGSVESALVAAGEERSKRIREWARPYWKEEYDKATSGWFSKWFPMA